MAGAAGNNGGRSLVWLQGLACGAAVAVAPAASCLLAALLAPAIAALLFDRAPGRPIARAILLCGSAPCVWPMLSFWEMGDHAMSAGFALLSDPRVLGMAWSAGGAGWLLSLVLPLGVRGILEAASLTRTALLRAERERLVREWGLDDQ